MKNIMIVGATSAVAQAVSRLYAKEHASFFLIARNAARLESVAKDLRVLGAKSVETNVCDLNDLSKHAALVAQAKQALGQIDLCLVAHGYLGDQKKSESNFQNAKLVIDTNFTSPASLLTELAIELEAQRSGTIAALSSPAGDRGRYSNYVYGSAKGALTIFLSGLRARLSHHGVQVVTIKLGFVDSPMTADFKKGPLWITPDKLAPKIVRAIDSKRDVTYLPWFWALIMLVFKLMPERIFKRMKF